MADEAVTKPALVFFHSARSGHCRRVDGFISQVLQRRGNHDTFKLYRIERDEQPELVERFGIVIIPTLIVLEGRRIRARLERPRDCRSIEALLDPWLARKSSGWASQATNAG